MLVIIGGINHQTATVSMFNICHLNCTLKISFFKLSLWVFESYPLAFVTAPINTVREKSGNIEHVQNGGKFGALIECLLF